MDMLPKVGGVDPYQGGAQQRPGTGSFSRKKKHEDAQGQEAESESAALPAEFTIDPFLADIDRLRALDPDLTESGAHRALMAVRAYQRTPGEATLDAIFGDDAPPAADAAADVETRTFTRPETPPGATTGSDGEPT
jgi:hypothetical protein